MRDEFLGNWSEGSHSFLRGITHLSLQGLYLKNYKQTQAVLEHFPCLTHIAMRAGSSLDVFYHTLDIVTPIQSLKLIIFVFDDPDPLWQYAKDDIQTRRMTDTRIHALDAVSRENIGHVESVWERAARQSNCK